MGKHTIKVEDMKGYVHKFLIASSSGKGSNKNLICEVHLDDESIRYSVMNHGEIIYSGKFLSIAIEYYNELV